MADSARLNGIDRREFLKAAGLTAVVASTAGAAAAMLVEQNNMTLLPPPKIPTAALESSQTGHLANLVSDLMRAQIENARLRTELKSTERKLELSTLSQDGQEGQVAKTLQSQLDESTSQNNALTTKVTVLAGLLALYEQLENVDLSTIAEEGVSSVEEFLGDIVDQVPTAQEGLLIGQQAMDQLESEIPALESGRQWLVEQFNAIGDRFDGLELTLRNSVKASGTTLQLLGEWFQSLLKWLPFGIGDSAAATMDNISQLLDEILNTEQGLDLKLVTALDNLLDQDGEVTALQSQVINPVRDQAIAPAKKVINQTAELQTVLESDLIDPLTLATGQRNDYRELIAAFRQSHQV
jgi:chromosome segregation ATPase